MALVHRIRPSDGDPEGALILLHGRGADEHDLFGLLDVLDPERRLVGVTPGAPLTGIPPGGRHWYLVPRVGYPDPPTFHAARGALEEFLDDFLASHALAWDRAVIGGFSMGCVMSYVTGLGPGRPSPAGIVGLSGFVPTVEGWTPDFDDRARLPVFLHHGRRDPIISVDFGRAARDALTDGGLDVEYLETDAAHFVPEEAIEPARALVARALGQPVDG